MIRAAISRLEAELTQAAPLMASQVSQWLRHLAQAQEPEAYFQNPIGFPLLRLPDWLEKTLQPAPSPAFQSDLVYSSVNGYYYIRLLDNVMDGHATVERELLPAAGFFHTQFQLIYQRYFDPTHPFWEFFKQTWFHSAEATIQDHTLTQLNPDQFRQFASQKVGAGKIPLAAVCHYYGQVEALGAWLRFFDAFGAWHQMWNDLFDWNKDQKYGTRTYFLSEADRRKHPNESVAAWVVREGFVWGVATLHDWMGEVKTLASALQSPDLMAYLAWREHEVVRQAENLANGLQHLGKLAAAMPAGR